MTAALSHPGFRVLLSLSALLCAPTHAGSGLGAETGPCLGPDCPSRYRPPAACRKLGAEGRDEAYSLVVGGNFQVLQGSEAEGRVYVGGDLVLRTRGYYNLVQVGAGACVVPPDADQASSPPHLVVGGQIQPLDPGAVLAVGQPNLRSTAIIGGARVGAGQVQARGGVLYQTRPPSPPVDFSSLAQRSAYWATLPPTGTVRGQHPMVLQGDGQSALQVFSLRADLPSGGLRLKDIPPGATVLINHQGSATVNLQYYDMTDPAGHGGFQFDTELTRRMLWNFPQASQVKLGGGAQWQGSVLVAQGALYNALPGLNGRVLVAGDLTQDSQGSEFHNYDFLGELPDPPTDGTPTTEPGPDTPSPEDPPESPPDNPPPGPMQAALNILLRYDGDAARITQAPQLQIQSQCERSGTQSVRITPPTAGWIEGLQTDESCLLVASLERPAQLPRGWQLLPPQAGQWVGDNPRVITPDTNPVELLLPIRPVINATLRVLPRYLGNTRAIQIHPHIELSLRCSHSGEQTVRLQAPQIGQSALLQDGERCEVLAQRITGAVLQGGYTLSLPGTGGWSPGSTLVAGDAPDPIPLDISILGASPGDEPEQPPEPPPPPPPAPPAENRPSTLNSIPLLTPWGLLGLAGGLGLLSLGTWMGPAIHRRQRRPAASHRSSPINENRGCAGSARPGSGPAVH